MTEQDRVAFLDAMQSRPWSSEENCFWFVREVRLALFDDDSLPIIPTEVVSDRALQRQLFAEHPARALWRAVDHPEDGDVAIMTRFRDLHAGIYLTVGGRGLLWHSDVTHGVASETLMEVTAIRRWKPTFFRRIR